MVFRSSCFTSPRSYSNRQLYFWGTQQVCFSLIPIFGYWFPGETSCLAGTWSKMEWIIYKKLFKWQIQSLCFWNVHELIVVSFCWKLFSTLAGDFEHFFFTVRADFEQIPDVDTGYLQPDDCGLFSSSFLSLHKNPNPSRRTHAK